MFSIEGPFYAKVDYVPHIYNDGLLHKKLGIDKLDYEEREGRLLDMDAVYIEGFRTITELYVVATPMMNFGKHYFDNSMHLHLEIEDSEWAKLEAKFSQDDLEEIMYHTQEYSDLYQVSHINKEEYISKTQLKIVS